MTLKDLLGEKYHEGIALEEVENALSSIEVTDFARDDSDEVSKLRKALSKSNSEAADYKKQLRARMTEQEAKEREEAEAREKLQNDYNELKKLMQLSDMKARFLALGYDEEAAQKTAEAMLEGNQDVFFENQKKIMDGLQKKIREDLMKGNPRPSGSGGYTGKSIDEIMKIRDPAERQKAIAENIELFEES